MRLWWALLLIGLVVGHAFDDCAAQPTIKRDGRVVLHADLHVHTRFSDGFSSPFGVVMNARRQGLDAIAVTEHNNVFPAELAAWFSNMIGGPIVVIGEEVTTRNYHLLAYGLKESISPRQDLASVIREVRAQGGIAVAAHPVERYWPALDSVAELLDGVEVVHPAAHLDGGSFRWEQMVAFHERTAADGHAKTAIGSSDYHFFKLLGLGRTLVFARESSAPGVVEALRLGQTVVDAPDGRRFGDAQWMAHVAEQPLPKRPDRVGYTPSGPLDLLGRLLGCFGLLGLLLVRGERN